MPGYRTAAQLASSGLPITRLEEAVDSLVKRGVPCSAVVPRAVGQEAGADAAKDGKAKASAKAGKAGKAGKGRHTAPEGPEGMSAEASLAAFGPASRLFFATDGRRPSMLLPPALPRDARAEMIRRGAAALEAALPQAEFGLGRDAAAEAHPPAGEYASHTLQRPLHRLFEVQAKYVCQRAMWREAVRRSTQSSETAGGASTLSIGELVGLLGEGISTALTESPSLRRHLARLGGCELPQVLRRWAWSNVLLDRLELETVTRAMARVGVAELHPSRGRRMERILSRGVSAGGDIVASLQHRAVMLLELTQRCSGGQLPANAGSVALALLHGMATDPSDTPTSEADPPPAAEIAMLLHALNHAIPQAKHAGALILRCGHITVIRRARRVASLGAAVGALIEPLPRPPTPSPRPTRHVQLETHGAGFWSA